MDSSDAATMKYDWFTNVLGSEPLLARQEWMSVVHSIKESWQRQKDSTLLRALETGILRTSGNSAKSQIERSGEDTDRISVTCQCPSFGSERAAEAFVRQDSCTLSDNEMMSVQYSGILHQSKNSYISGTYQYDTKGSHSASWQALVDLHPKIGFEMQHSSETGDIETSVDVGPLFLGTCLEYQTTQLSKFQKAMLYRKHHEGMSSSLSLSAAPTGAQNRTMKAQIFKKKKRHHAPSEIESNGWFPQVDLGFTQTFPSPSSSSPSAVWKLDHVGYTQSLAHICNLNTQASVKLYQGTKPRTSIDLSHGFDDGSLLCTVSSEITDRVPSFTFKAKDHRRQDSKIVYQMSWKPKREGDSVGMSIKAKYPKLSFLVQVSRGDIRAKFYRQGN